MRRDIFLAQALDHMFPLLGCLILLVAVPRSIGAPEAFLLPASPFSLVASLAGALFVASLCYRTLCVGLFGRTLGMLALGLRPRDETSGNDLIVSHLWEALSLACPPLWALDILARKAGKRIGFDYVFCYKNSL